MTIHQANNLHRITAGNFPWHLPLAVLLPILSLYASNLGQFDLSVVWIPLLVLTLLAIVLTLEMRLRYKNWVKAAVAVSAILYLTFNYTNIREIFSDGLALHPDRFEPILLYFITVLVLAFLFWIARRAVHSINGFFNLFFLAATLLLVFKVVNYYRPSALLAERFLVGNRVADQRDLPDIYYIILDAYPRADVLDRVYGIDNTAFLSALEKRGFYLADCSLSNYPKTILHSAATLNMQYLDFSELEGQSITVKDFYKLTPYFYPMIADSQLQRQLKSAGYRIIDIRSKFNFLSLPKADAVYAISNLRENSFNQMLLSRTPLGSLQERLEGYLRVHAPMIDAALDNDTAHGQQVLFSLETLAAIPGSAEPSFVFAHIASPHGPHIFNPQGEIVANSEVNPPDSPEFLQGYQNQIEFINAQILAVIDAIQSRSARQSIIVIQSDHGQFLHVEGSYDTISPPEDTTPILNAFYFPDGDYHLLSESITPVNTFRVILDHYLGTSLGLLPDRSFHFGVPMDYVMPQVYSESSPNCFD